MIFSKIPDRYQTSVNTFNDVAKKYLAYFKNFPMYQPSYDWLLESLSDEHQQVLDVACGPGQVGHYLVERNQKLQLNGVDLAPNMIALAKQLNPLGHFEVMDCRDINQLNRSFDVIICGFCTPYLSKSDSLQLIKDMSSMLVHNGILYLSLTTSDEADGYQSSKSSAGQVYVHYHDIELILTALKKSGLEIFKHEKIKHVHNEQMMTDEFLLAKKL